MVWVLLLSVLVFIVIIIIIKRVYGTQKAFRVAMASAFETLDREPSENIREEDIKALPVPLQVYLRKANVVGSPRVQFFHVSMTGAMKMDESKAFAPVKADQYTFVKSGIRLFFMTMNYHGIPIAGLHHYHKDDAMMKVKLLDLFQVVHESGTSMQKAETVTYFNDLCIMAPGGLIEEDIDWEVIDDQSIRGTLRKHGFSVQAVLKFNAEGMLENFVSDDRLALSHGGQQIQVPWSTPMLDFGPVGEFNLACRGSAVWHHESGDFEYIQLNLQDVRVNQV